MSRSNSSAVRAVISPPISKRISATTSPRCTSTQPPSISCSRLTAIAIAASDEPMHQTLWLSCATEQAERGVGIVRPAAGPEHRGHRAVAAIAVDQRPFGGVRSVALHRAIGDRQFVGEEILVPVERPQHRRLHGRRGPARPGWRSRRRCSVRPIFIVFRRPVRPVDRGQRAGEGLALRHQLRRRRRRARSTATARRRAARCRHSGRA